MAHGRFVTASPGPTTIPEQVLNAMHRDTTNYGAVLQSGREIADDLRKVAGSSQHIKVYPGNGHTGWQAALANVLQEGDTAVLLDSKGFAHLWGLCAESTGIVLRDLSPSALHQPVRAEALQRCLMEDAGHKIKAVMVAHTESDFTVSYDLRALRAAIDAAAHPALFMVDCVATFGCVPVEVDAWGVDVVVAASQKGLMLPPGLAILCISDKALEARKRKRHVPMILDWFCGMSPEPLGHWSPKEGAVPWIAPGTPPTNLLLGLQASLDMILRQHGLEQTWARHETFARATWAAVEAWGRSSSIRCFVDSEAHRSRVVTLVKAEGLDAARLRQWCLQEAGLLLPGAGLGFLFPPGEGQFQQGFVGSDAFRIGHMGYSSPSMMLGTLATIDCAFKALGIPHGENAVGAAASVIAAGWTEANTT